MKGWLDPYISPSIGNMPSAQSRSHQSSKVFAHSERMVNKQICTLYAKNFATAWLFYLSRRGNVHYGRGQLYLWVLMYILTSSHSRIKIKGNIFRNLFLLTFSVHDLCIQMFHQFLPFSLHDFFVMTYVK